MHEVISFKKNLEDLQKDVEQNYAETLSNSVAWSNLADDVRRLQVKTDRIEANTKDILERVQSVEEAVMEISKLIKAVYCTLTKV
ncbi:MAG: hypothetical protein RLY43_1870 [Bacteroidota bacterium]